jgi:antitoxin MazE
MRTRIQKWGNSLALRIPRAIAAEVNLEIDTVVDISLVDGKLVLVPVNEPSLEDLLAGVTEENVHRAIDSGPSVGNEAW